MFQASDEQGLSYSTIPTIPGLEELATPSRLYLVDVVDSGVFEEAMGRLMVEARVGLNCLGEAVGREGVLSLLVLATARDVFVFDLQLLGTEGFQYGLWAVLRRPELVKVGATLATTTATATLTQVVHDVRQMSDLLFHQFNLTLANVFDTMAAHLVVANWEAAVPGAAAAAPRLADSARRFLRLGGRAELGLRRDSDPVWRSRALAPQLLVAAATSALLLLPLARELELRLGDPVARASAALLQEVRGIEDDEEARQANLAPHINPDSMVVSLPAWRRR